MAGTHFPISGNRGSEIAPEIGAQSDTLGRGPIGATDIGAWRVVRGVVDRGARCLGKRRIPRGLVAPIDLPADASHIRDDVRINRIPRRRPRIARIKGQQSRSAGEFMLESGRRRIGGRFFSRLARENFGAGARDGQRPLPLVGTAGLVTGGCGRRRRGLPINARDLRRQVEVAGISEVNERAVPQLVIQIKPEVLLVRGRIGFT